MNIDEYSELTGTGFEIKEATKPEDDFFHSLYISGQSRKNHINIIEEIGKFQIRGVEYNIPDEVYMIITHVKNILCKTRFSNGKENVECFSYCTGEPPWKSTSSFMCGKNSAERASVPFCQDCRSQVIMAGIWCDKDGNLKMGANGKPVFMFVRGKGVKYSNVANYLSDLSKLDLDPIFTPVTAETTKFEKSTVNHKRFVTRIYKGIATSKFGNKTVFEFERGIEIPKNQVPSLLKVAKQTLKKFNEKFDWTQKQSSSGYSTLSSDQTFDNTSSFPDHDKKESVFSAPPINFEDLEF